MQEVAGEKTRLSAALAELEGRMASGQEQYVRQAGVRIISWAATCTKCAYYLHSLCTAQSSA